MIDSHNNKDATLQRRTVKDVDIKGKRILMRVDFNVPLDKKTGSITDDTRIRAAIPTIQYCLEEGAKRVVLISHLGRPDGKVNPQMSLMPCAERLQELLGVPVKFVTECIGEVVERELGPSGVYLLENLRFHAEEEEGSDQFAKQLSAYGDVFVNDAFGTVHRPHASISHITIPIRVGGLLLSRELEMFSLLLEQQDGLDLAILGGAKVSDKIMLIDRLLEKVKRVVIGGAMAFTFLKELRVCSIGNSLYDAKGAEHVKEIMVKAQALGVKILLPVDFRCAASMDGSEVSVFTDKQGIPDGMSGFDIGPQTEHLFAEAIQQSKAVLWNGPMGVFESAYFAKGTVAVIDALHSLTTCHHGVTVVGGGDTAAAVHNLRPGASMSHVSTGGGASLELMEGKALPGISCLLLPL